MRGLAEQFPQPRFCLDSMCGGGAAACSILTFPSSSFQHPLPPLQTQVQMALVQASMATATHLQGECWALREAAAERDAAIRALCSQRDCAIRALNQKRQRCVPGLRGGGGQAGPLRRIVRGRLTRLRGRRRLAETLDCAEAKDGEVEGLRKRRAEVRGRWWGGARTCVGALVPMSRRKGSGLPPAWQRRWRRGNTIAAHVSGAP